MRLLIINIILLLSALNMAAARALKPSSVPLDSLLRIYSLLPDSDKAKMPACEAISGCQLFSDSTIAWGNRLMFLSVLNKSDDFTSKALRFLALGYFQKGDYVTSSGYNHKSLKIAQEIGAMQLVASNQAMLGDNSLGMCSYDQAEKHYRLALDVFKELGDSVNIALCYRRLAEGCGRQKLYSQANRLFKAAYRIDSTLNIPELMSLDLQSMGETKITRFFFVITKHDIALLRDAKADLLRACRLGSPDLPSRFQLLYILSKCMHAELLTYRIMGVDRERQIIDSLADISKEVDAIAQLLVEQKYVMGKHLVRANLMSLSGRLNEARQALDSVMPFISEDQIALRDLVMDYYLCSDIYYRMKGDYRMAYEIKSQYYETQNSQLLLDYAVNSAMRAEQSRHDDIIKEKDSEQQLFRNMAMLVILITLILLAFLILGYLRKRKHLAILNHKSHLLSVQKKEISDQNKVITSSLNYASIIQHAVMPSQEALNDIFGDIFVLYYPLNIVSGDFFWAASLGRFKALACGDCTGHGVPGAMLSMLGISLLNEIVAGIPGDSASPAVIMEYLREKLMSSLGQNPEKYEPGEGFNKDGIDMGLVLFDFDGMTAHYAGGCRPLWIVREGEVIKYKADRIPIGMFFGEYKGFRDNIIELKHGDMVYMFSDGIIDQFGYVDDERKTIKHFSSQRLAQLLLSVYDLPASQQKKMVADAISAWENGHRQIDDIIVIGIRVA